VHEALRVIVTHLAIIGMRSAVASCGPIHLPSILTKEEPPMRFVMAILAALCLLPFVAHADGGNWTACAQSAPVIEER